MPPPNPPLPHPPLEMIRKKRISLLFLESPDFYLWVSIFSFIRGWQVCKYINQVPLVGGLKAPGYVDATLREIVKVMHCVRLPSMAPPASKAPPPMLISVDEFNVIYIFWVQYFFFFRPLGIRQNKRKNTSAGQWMPLWSSANVTEPLSIRNTPTKTTEQWARYLVNGGITWAQKTSRNM